MRAFIAVNIDDDVRAVVAEIQQRLRASGADVKWVRPEGIHVTLKFLGEVDETRLPEVEDAVRAAVARIVPFRLRLEGVGTFPSASAPRVVWVGIEEGARELRELAQRIEEALEPLGFEREGREFSAHVTMGRVRTPRERERLVAMINEARGQACGEMAVSWVHLMRSDLRPAGPIYTSQCEFELGGAQTGQGER